MNSVDAGRIEDELPSLPVEVTVRYLTYGTGSEPFTMEIWPLDAPWLHVFVLTMDQWPESRTTLVLAAQAAIEVQRMNGTGRFKKGWPFRVGGGT